MCVRVRVCVGLCVGVLCFISVELATKGQFEMKAFIWSKAFGKVL